MSIKVKRLKSILNRGDFHSDISQEATTALKESINLRKRYKTKQTLPNSMSLDFSRPNHIAIEKRGNLKVYQDLPKGIRVVAR